MGMSILEEHFCPHCGDIYLSRRDLMTSECPRCHHLSVEYISRREAQEYRKKEAIAMKMEG